LDLDLNENAAWIQSGAVFRIRIGAAKKKKQEVIEEKTIFWATKGDSLKIRTKL
jgi:hypothetical protein